MCSSDLNLRGQFAPHLPQEPQVAGSTPSFVSCWMCRSVTPNSFAMVRASFAPQAVPGVCSTLDRGAGISHKNSTATTWIAVLNASSGKDEARD